MLTPANIIKMVLELWSSNVNNVQINIKPITTNAVPTTFKNIEFKQFRSDRANEIIPKAINANEPKLK